MNTEITENIKGWVFYDGECALCSGWVERTYGLMLRRGFHFVPLQSNWATLRLGLNAGEPLREMKLLTGRGEIFGGADALVEIARGIWWLWPFYFLAQLPGVKPCLRIFYRWLAAHRHSFGNQSKIPHRRGKGAHTITRAFFEMP